MYHINLIPLLIILISDNLYVSTQVRPGPYYVGQAIEFGVGVVAEGERPEIGTPKVAGAEVTPLGTGLKPLSTSAIGNLVRERNLFTARFRIVAHRAGDLTVPPVVVRLGGRTGRSEAVRLMVRTLPAEGRPREFLGGVGEFQVAAEAIPATLRSGETLEYRLRVTGPAARGMTSAPTLDRLDRVPLGLEVEPMPTEAVADPPARVFRWRLRPTRAGEAVLPPVPIAAFDPRAVVYVTKLAPGVPLRVVDVPRFDPRSLTYGETAKSASRAVPWAIAASATALALSALVVIGVRARARRTGRRDVRRFIRRAARALDLDHDAAEMARRISADLAEYLRLAVARPTGALTPQEARDAFARATGSAALAERAFRLVAVCDRARFARLEPSAEMLVDEARGFFDDLRVVRPPAA